MGNKPTVTDILNHLLHKEKIRPSELARRTGVPQPTIHRMVTGTCPRPHKASLEPIANYFGLTIKQLRGGETIPGLNMFKLEQTDGWSTIPVVEWKHLSTWPKEEYDYSISEHGLTPKKRVLATTYTDAKVSLKAFSVYLLDDSMLPLFPKHSSLVFDPEREKNDNSFVLIRLENGDVIFRQLMIKDGQRYYIPLNKDYDQTPLALNYQDEIIGVLVQSRIDY